MKPDEPTGSTGTVPAAPGSKERWWRRALRFCLGLLAWLVLVPAILLYVPTNRGVLELFCVYPPPLLFLLVCLAAAVCCFRNRFRVRLACCAAAAALLAASFGWGGTEPPPAPADAFVLLAQ